MATKKHEAPATVKLRLVNDLVRAGRGGQMRVVARKGTTFTGFYKPGTDPETTTWFATDIRHMVKREEVEIIK